MPKPVIIKIKLRFTYSTILKIFLWLYLCVRVLPNNILIYPSLDNYSDHNTIHCITFINKLTKL